MVAPSTPRISSMMSTMKSHFAQNIKKMTDRSVALEEGQQLKQIYEAYQKHVKETGSYAKTEGHACQDVLTLDAWEGKIILMDNNKLMLFD